MEAELEKPVKEPRRRSEARRGEAKARRGTAQQGTAAAGEDAIHGGIAAMSLDISTLHAVRVRPRLRIAIVLKSFLAQKASRVVVVPYLP